MKSSGQVVGILVASLATIGCADDGASVGALDSATTMGEGTTSHQPQAETTTGTPPAPSTEGLADTTAGEGPRCERPQPVPNEPDCTGVDGVYEGGLVIGEGQNDPQVLAGIREVTGSVRLDRLDVTDLNFMECLQIVGGDLTIFGNDQLINVDGLRSLTTIGTRFVFSENDALTNFDGLPNITEVPENLAIRHNEALTSISGFHQLTTVGNLTIQNNPMLLDIDGLGGLRTVTGVFATSANPMLCISSVNCVGEGILEPAEPRNSWTTEGNDDDC